MRQHDDKVTFARAIMAWVGFGDDDPDSGRSRGLPRPTHPDPLAEAALRDKYDTPETPGHQMANHAMCKYVQQLALAHKVHDAALEYRRALMASWEFHGKQRFEDGVPVVAKDVAAACIQGLSIIPDAAEPAGRNE